MTTATFTPRVERTRSGTPKIRLTSDIQELFIERIVAPPNELDSLPPFADSNSMSFRGDKLYHYGHFVLAQIVRDGRRRVKLVLLNGDTYGGASGWGPSTSSRQGDIRNAVEALDGVKSIVLPFATLGAAGIDIETIDPIHVRAARYTHHPVTTEKRPGPHPKIADPSGATEMVTEESYGYHVNGTPATYGAEGATYGAYTVEREKPVMIDDTNLARVDARPTHGWVRDYAVLQPDGSWKYEVERHWLGDSIFRARVIEQRTRKLRPDEQAMVDARNEAAKHSREAHATYEELRRSTFTGPDEPSQELKDAVQAAWRAYNETERAVYDLALPDGFLTGSTTGIRYTVRRRATFLSSFDYGEPHAPYFMCEMPRDFDGETVDDAIQALMPAEVEEEIAVGVEVLRQGDIFAIPTDRTTEELVALGDPKRMRNAHGVVQILMKGRGDTGDVHGTNHQPTHLIITRNGEHYGRGRLYHVPGPWREPDHRVVKLGDGETWYRLVKNTVPLSKGQRGSVSAGRVFQSGQARAWTIGGVVD